MADRTGTSAWPSIPHIWMQELEQRRLDMHGTDRGPSFFPPFWVTSKLSDLSFQSWVEIGVRGKGGWRFVGVNTSSDAGGLWGTQRSRENRNVYKEHLLPTFCGNKIRKEGLEMNRSKIYWNDSKIIFLKFLN